MGYLESFEFSEGFFRQFMEYSRFKGYKTSILGGGIDFPKFAVI